MRRASGTSGLLARQRDPDADGPLVWSPSGRALSEGAVLGGQGGGQRRARHVRELPLDRYLELPFLDLVCFNVYLEKQARLEAYLSRLQNIAEDRPVILSEIGLDALRNGELAQAESLDWQIRSAFAGGCAGAFVFSWTDEWHRAGEQVDDWAFGITDLPAPTEAGPGGRSRGIRRGAVSGYLVAPHLGRRLHLQRVADDPRLPRRSGARGLSALRSHRRGRRLDRRHCGHRARIRRPAYPDREPRPEQRAQHRPARSDGRDHRLPRRRCASGRALAEIPRSNLRHHDSCGRRRTQHPAAG